jgi:hypothetical protein
VKELLTDKFPAEKSEQLARLFSEGAWTHDYPITYEAAKQLGFPVRSEMPTEILQLMRLFPQPASQAAARLSQ